MAAIAIYVQAKYAKKAYKVDSYNVRTWGGVELIKSVLVTNGYEVGYCSAATVKDQDIVLVSIVSTQDWYTFAAERLTWPKGKYTVIIGGPGVWNLRPVLWMGDVFVFGRGETIILPLVQHVLKGNEFIHESVAYPETFDPDNKKYRICQATEFWPHPVPLADGKEWREHAIGCNRRCLFCSYTWQRKHIGEKFNIRPGDFSKGMLQEQTMFDIDLEHPENWSTTPITVGLDGLSERIRRMVNKKITRDLLRRFLMAAMRQASLKPTRAMRINNIVGFPTEGINDLGELLEDFRLASEAHSALGITMPQRRMIIVHSTPFRSLPVTPAAGWPMARLDFRRENLVFWAKQIVKPWPKNLTSGLSLYEDRNLYVIASNTIESLSSSILEAILFRGFEKDTDLVRKLSATSKFWSSNSVTRLATLEKACDIDRFLREYAPKDLPTWYLEAYIPREKLYQFWRNREGSKAAQSAVAYAS